jgi:microcystin-dependent protein
VACSTLRGDQIDFDETLAASGGAALVGINTTGWTELVLPSTPTTLQGTLDNIDDYLFAILNGTRDWPEISPPASPAANKWRLYFKTTGLFYKDDGGTETGPLGAGGVTDHGGLTGLTDDDHSIYALLAGRAGGQVFKGGDASGNNLDLWSTNHATKGKIRAIDSFEAQSQLLLSGTSTPAQLAADQNDYAPSGAATATVIMQDVDTTPRTITGLAGGGAGRFMIIRNTTSGSSSGTIILAHESTSSSAANRFTCPSGVDFDIGPGRSAFLRYDATSSRWLVETDHEIPAGSMMMWTTTTAPPGWLVCNGSAVSRAQYVRLFKVIGTQFGIGDGSSTFNLPDMQQRVPMGYRQSTSEYALADQYGSDSHSHTANVAAASAGRQNGPNMVSTTGDSVTVQSADHRPKYTVLLFIIKY